MRTIKFRAWDTDLKVMFQNWSVMPDYKTRDYLLENGKTLPEEIIILMQFTGLFDRNGKEIYCGDILQDYEGKLSEVIWVEASAKFWIKRLNWKQNGEDTWHILTFSGEVIGNIYENPNLIKQNK